MSTVTYTGEDGALTHGRPGGRRYTFFRNKPLEVSDKDDVAFYRLKEERGSPFKVDPALVKEVVKEPFHEVEKPVKRPPTTRKYKGRGNISKKPDNQPSRQPPITPESEIFI